MHGYAEPPDIGHPENEPSGSWSGLVSYLTDQVAATIVITQIALLAASAMILLIYIVRQRRVSG